MRDIRADTLHTALRQIGPALAQSATEAGQVADDALARAEAEKRTQTAAQPVNAVNVPPSPQPRPGVK